MWFEKASNHGRARRQRDFKLDLRAPEDAFASDDRVAQGRSVHSPLLDRLMRTYFDAWARGDKQTLLESAKALVFETEGLSKLQGVPTHAHPPVPWDFVEVLGAEFERQPPDARSAMVRTVLDTFEPSARAGLARQLAHPVSGRSVTLGGDEGTEGPSETQRRRGRPSPPSKPQREPPREVHPPARAGEREARCQWLHGHISSLRMSRGSWISERKRHLEDRSKWQASYDSNYEFLKDRERKLAAAERQLLGLETSPPNTPTGKRNRKREVGPVPDIVNHAIANELRRRIAKLQKEIETVRSIMSGQADKIHEFSAKIKNVEGKLSEVEGQLIEPEREYRLKCGRLGPPPGTWR